MLQGPLRQHPLLLLLLIASSPCSSSDSWLFLLRKDSRNAAGLLHYLLFVLVRILHSCRAFWVMDLFRFCRAKNRFKRRNKERLTVNGTLNSWQMSARLHLHTDWDARHDDDAPTKSRITKQKIELRHILFVWKECQECDRIINLPERNISPTPPLTET
jgi:hypothetical protein